MGEKKTSVSVQLFGDGKGKVKEKPKVRARLWLNMKNRVKRMFHVIMSCIQNRGEGRGGVDKVSSI